MSNPADFNTHDLALRTFELLKENRTERGLNDLGHGEIELLREVILKITVKRNFPDQEQTLQCMASTLLLLKCLLLGWDCQGFPEKTCALPALAHDQSVLSHKHTHKEIYRTEIQSCLLFLAGHKKAFQDEAWLWLQSCLMNLQNKLTAPR